MSSGEFIFAVKSGNYDRVVEFLTADSGLASATDENGVPAILVAIYYGHPTIADAIAAKRGGDLSVFEAAVLGHENRVRELIISDPGLVNAWSPDGYTPLQFAAYFGRKAAAEVLLANSAQIDVISQNPMKVAPLHAALAGGHIEIANMLISGGASPNLQSGSGWSALHYAADIGDAEMAKLLLDRGADTSLRNQEGDTPAEHGRKVGHDHVAEIIENSRASV